MYFFSNLKSCLSMLATVIFFILLLNNLIHVTGSTVKIKTDQEVCVLQWHGHYFK